VTRPFPHRERVEDAGLVGQTSVSWVPFRVSQRTINEYEGITTRRAMVIQDMTITECHSLLSRTRLGRVGCARNNQPYVVPIYFVFEKPFLYGFTTLGQKVEWMRLNPFVCIEVDDVEDTDQWMSVVAFGHYEELPDTPGRNVERLHAHKLLEKHRGWWEPGCASHTHRRSEKPVTPVFYRIRIDSITGRRATPAP
jgi:nitroimidazol reductase NimA-like FMN-containing flavoprotein (pyridoxamine 5'-phosphate oxidase superfamily)